MCYIAVIQCAAGAFHTLIRNELELTFFVIYCKLMQLIIIGFFFGTALFTALRKPELRNKVVVPITAATVIAITVMFILAGVGIMNHSETNQCLNLSFIMLSSTGLVLGLLVFASGMKINTIINERLIMSEGFKQKKKQELYILLWLYFISAVTEFSWDLFLILFIHISHSNCDTALGGPVAQNISVMLVRAINLFIPLSALLFFAFRTAKRKITRVGDRRHLVDSDHHYSYTGLSVQ